MGRRPKGAWLEIWEIKGMAGVLELYLALEVAGRLQL